MRPDSLARFWRYINWYLLTYLRAAGDRWLSCDDVTVCRYVLNYLPFGAAYKACNLLPSKMVIVTVREVYRVRQIHTGFVYASTKFPNSAIVVAAYAVMLGVY